MSDDTEWRSALTDTTNQVRDSLGQALLDAVGDAPLAAKPLVWSSQDGDRTTWRALALTGRLVASAHLSMKQVDALEIVVTVVPMSRVGEIVWTTVDRHEWRTVTTTATLTLGDLKVDLPDLSEDDATFLHALSQRL